MEKSWVASSRANYHKSSLQCREVPILCRVMCGMLGYFLRVSAVSYLAGPFHCSRRQLRAAHQTPASTLTGIDIVLVKGQVKCISRSKPALPRGAELANIPEDAPMSLHACRRNEK